MTEAHQTVERNPSMKPYVHETNPVERQAAHTWDVRMCDMMISREKRSIFTTQTDGFEDKASQRLAYCTVYTD